MKNSIQKIRVITFQLAFGLMISSALMSFQSSSFASTRLMEAMEACGRVSFGVVNNGCEGPCQITFVNTSENAINYLWDFGDGNSSSAENPQHTYQTAGTYTVSLKGFINECEHEFIGTVDIVSL